jgi:hypothetical protein
MGLHDGNHADEEDIASRPDTSPDEQAPSNAWNDPAQLRQRVLQVESVRGGQPSGLSEDPAVLRRRVVELEERVAKLEPVERPPGERPGCVTAYVVLLGLAWILAGLVALAYVGGEKLCVEQGSCYSLSSLEPAGAVILIVFGLGVFIFYALMIYGLWNMRLWGWWMVVFTHSLNIVLGLCAINSRTVFQWVVSGLILWWFVANKWRFGPTVTPSVKRSFF